MRHMRQPAARQAGRPGRATSGRLLRGGTGLSEEHRGSLPCGRDNDPRCRDRGRYGYVTTSLGPPKVELTAAPVPLITDSIPPDPFRNTVSRSWNWTPDTSGAWNAIAFSIATPWSK